MEIVDLTRELYHRTQAHPNHPPVVVTAWRWDDANGKPRESNRTTNRGKALYLSFSDHAGTHVDAPAHFDPNPGAMSIDEVPLQDFYTSGFCIDLSHVPLRTAASLEEVQFAVSRSGQTIRRGDTVLVWMATNERLMNRPGYLHDFPGLSPAAIYWLAEQGIGMIGVEGISAAPEGELNLKAHEACADLGITQMKGLMNLRRLVGRGRFRFIGFPLKIRGGTASPIRAVAVFE